MNQLQLTVAWELSVTADQRLYPDKVVPGSLPGLLLPLQDFFLQVVPADSWDIE